MKFKLLALFFAVASGNIIDTLQADMAKRQGGRDPATMTDINKPRNKHCIKKQPIDMSPPRTVTQAEGQHPTTSSEHVTPAKRPQRTTSSEHVTPAKRPQRTTTSEHENCPEGWTLHMDKCYKYFPEKVSQKYAKEKCKAEYAELVLPRSEEDMIFLDTITDHWRLWINANKREGRWVDKNGATIRYTNWLRKNGPKGRSICVAMEDGHFWFTQRCSYKYPYVCAKPENQLGKKQEQEIDKLGKKQEQEMDTSTFNLGVTFKINQGPEFNYPPQESANLKPQIQHTLLASAEDAEPSVFNIIVVYIGHRIEARVDIDNTKTSNPAMAATNVLLSLAKQGTMDVTKHHGQEDGEVVTHFINSVSIVSSDAPRPTHPPGIDIVSVRLSKKLFKIQEIEDSKVSRKDIATLITEGMEVTINVPPPPPPTPGSVCTGVKEKVAIVLDSSTSIADDNFQKMLEFTADLVRYFDMTYTKVAVVVFGTNAKVEIHMDDYDNANKTEFIQRILDIQHLKDTDVRYYEDSELKIAQLTKTWKALDLVREKVFTSAHGDSPEVPHVVVVVTDGSSGDMERTKKAADDLRKTCGATVYAIGVGSIPEDEELMSIASEPKMRGENWYHISEFNDLINIEDHLAMSACKALPRERRSAQDAALFSPHELPLIYEEDDDYNYLSVPVTTF